MEEDLGNLPRHYQINVVIIEGRHLALTNANTYVVISIGKKKKRIFARTNKTDSPYYNDFCVFPFYTTLNTVLEKILIIRVYQVKRLIKKLVGSFNVELSTVWSQPNHQFYHKWAVLSDPQNPSAGVKGFLKCDIVILTSGVVIKPPDEDIEEELEENILVPFGAVKDRHRAKIVFSIFRADNFSSYFGDYLDLNLIQPYVKITYGGVAKKTSLSKNKGAPVWNEELEFLDLFPPLCQNILVELCDSRKLGKKSSIGNTNIDIRSIYEDGENGFLPTFGPNFLYLYQPRKKFKRHKNYCNIQNSFTYMCRLLVAVRTEIIDYAEDVFVRRKKPPKSIPPLLESMYFEYKKFILFAAILDVLFFDSKYIENNINFRLTLGPKKNVGEINLEQNEEKTEIENTDEDEMKNPKHLNILNTCNTTPNQKCVVKTDYSFIAFSGNFPCVYVFGEWPDFLRKMYRSNVIKKAIQNFTNEVNKIKDELEYENEKLSESSQKLNDILADLSKSCEIILFLTKNIKKEDTNLCRERKRYYHREIAEIIQKAKSASTESALKAEDALRKISAYLATLTKFAQDPENSFPDTELWMRKNGKISAQYRIRTEDIAYSSDSNERGIMSGKPQTILIKGEKEKTKIKMDIFVWFGLADDFVQCLKMLPQGYKYDYAGCSPSIILQIPTVITYEEPHLFQCNVHIFQAKILIGFDDTGLADPFVRIIILGQNKVTQTQKATLSPIWNETLVFPIITLYGDANYIKKNPLNVVVEVFDKDRLKSELIGRCLVKPAMILLKGEDYEPPKLKWEGIKQETREVGKVLMAIELLEHSESMENLHSDTNRMSFVLPIPEEIRPHNVNYRLEIIFWGVRQLKRKISLRNKVFMTVECGEKIITSPVIHNVRHKLNFDGRVQFINVNLPEELEYVPPLSFKLFHISSITSAKSYVATCIIPSARYFFFPFRTTFGRQIHIDITEEERNKEKKEEQKRKKKQRIERSQMAYNAIEQCFFLFVKLFRYIKCVLFKKCEISAFELEPDIEEEDLNWWMRYNASVGDSSNYPGVRKIKIFNEELEAQPEFKGFQDFLRTFNMITGHEKRGKKDIVVAKVKLALAFYKWPPEEELINQINPERGVFSRNLTNDPVKVVVRVYVICGKNLAPRDIYGKSDPYLLVRLGKKTISDRNNYAPKQINPTFGKFFEFKGTFPFDHLLKVEVIDYDASSNDDLIGETQIDVENRYYSKHHATCGLAETYEEDSSSPWRDFYPPSEILKKVCQNSDLALPIYESDKVKIEEVEFSTPVPAETKHKREVQALTVLHRWHEVPFKGFHLVPEHIETRSLYHPSLPGIEQGKLHMWVDVFPADFTLMPPKVDISPRPGEPMELRAIVWNVDDVVLDDKSFFFNERMSDIYVRGWILSLEEETQRTDVHYRSLNGEGNFNWRFIFHFNYIPTERMIIVKKKLDAFDLHPEETKHFCKLELQIWDNDAFGDDYLGTLILELCSMPRGAKLSNRCTLKMLSPNNAKINLFKIKRTRGWWPFRRLKENQSVGNEFELTGKIDLELEILTETEAKRYPAGKGREEPNALPPPERPATSYNWMLSPLKSFRFVIWRKMSRSIIMIVAVVLMTFFVLTALYAFPNYFVKKLLHA